MSKPGSKEFVAEVMDRLFVELKALRECGQKEYAHDDTSAFANFERVAARWAKRGVSREVVLFIYLEKHLDGITAFINGHKSQREPVQGRIKDAIVYLTLLMAMIEQGELTVPTVTCRS